MDNMYSLFESSGGLQTLFSLWQIIWQGEALQQNRTSQQISPDIDPTDAWQQQDTSMEQTT
jgi:hypothetical protein